MWVLLAFGSAFFAGVTSILAKCGIKKTDSNLATAIRTVVVVVFAWVMVFLAGSSGGITQIGAKSMCFLVLSGFATGASWLCYFRALQLGSVNKVVPIDKSSTVLTILLAILIFGETQQLAVKLIGVALIFAGTLLMLEKKPETDGKKEDLRWMLYAVLSAVFAALTSILGKIGIENVESNLGTAIRTVVVLVMSWVVVAVTSRGKKTLHMPDKKELLFICLSGLATGASWICYFRALQTGVASVVVPIDKLSILVTIAFSSLFLHEKLTPKALLGLGLITAGTLGMVLFR